MNVLRTLLAALWLAGAGVPAQVDDSTELVNPVDTAAEPRFVVRLPRLDQTVFPELDTLVITIATSDAELGGFDLKIGTDSRILSIVDILPAALHDSCGWEYFAARDLGGALTGDSLTSLWKLVGLARSAEDTLKPACDTLPGGVSLARLVVAFNPMVASREEIADIFFYWESCADNTISAASGRRMAISRQVHDFPGVHRARVNGFPTRSGAPKQCVKPAARYHPLRQIVFHNGGVRLQLPDQTKLPVEFNNEGVDLVAPGGEPGGGDSADTTEPDTTSDK